ncbi:MAG: hypothetical protein V1794_11670, partial [Candidatus Glassbacteria bacterium]
ATLNSHPLWKTDRLPDFYYEVLSRAVDLQARCQAADGRFRTRLPRSGDSESGWRITGMQFIYAPALIYVTDHPANPKKGDRAMLEMALRAGDYLAAVVGPDGEVRPTVDGRPVDDLDAHRTIYCWTEAYALLEPYLDPARKKSWREAIQRGGKAIFEQEVAPRTERPRYTSPFLGFSPNHMGLRSTTVWRMGMVLGIDEWVQRLEPALVRFIAEIRPGGYWEEHNGPTMSYDYLNVTVPALYWHYRHDPEALRACQLNTDYHLHWTTPDGVDIHTVDQRNRNHFEPSAGYGLFAFCNFPEGRRYTRFKILAALGDSDDPLAELGLESLARIAQAAHYHTDGPELPIPQELPKYRHELDRPAVVKKDGPWVYSMSALVGPSRPLSQFYLDRVAPISLWHERTGFIIGGGNSKGQPELATFSVKRADGSLDCLPLDGLIRGNWDADTLCVAHEGFSLRLTFILRDANTAVIRAQAERTYDRRGDSAQLNLPLVLHPGAALVSDGATRTLGDDPLTLDSPKSIAAAGWTIQPPAGAHFQWPCYIYNPYGDVRVPKDVRNALAVLSVPLEDRNWVEVKLTIE